MLDSTARAEIERLLAQQSSLTNVIRRDFLAAIDSAAANLDLGRIAEMIRVGHMGEAVAEVERVLAAHSFRAVAATVTQAALVAGRAAAAAMPAVGALEAVFGATNPRAVQHLENYAFDLIREMSAEARRTVGYTIATGTTDGRNPINVARDVRGQIGLTQRQAQAVLNYRRELEAGGSGALDRALRDKRFDATVARAARGERALSQEQIDRLVERYQQRYLRYRAETIARTEAMRALNFGNLEAWRQAVDDGVVEVDGIVRQWVYTHDNRTRPVHREIPGMNPDGVGLDQPFETGLGPLMFPGDPNGVPGNTINCRCTTVIRYRPRGALPAAPAAPAPKPTKPARVFPWDAVPKPSIAAMKFGDGTMLHAKQVGVFHDDASARAVADALLGGLPRKEKIGVTWFKSDDDRLTMTASSKSGAISMTRTFYREDGELHITHSYFALNSKYQGGGHARAMLRSSVELYRDIGVKSIDLHANLDVGGYAWAKLGFGLSSNGKYTRSMFERRILGSGVSEANKSRLFGIMDNSSDADLMYNLATATNVEGEKIGKAILLGSDWLGSLRLDNPIQYARLVKELS